jgi:hypothetical protein
MGWKIKYKGGDKLDIKNYDIINKYNNKNNEYMYLFVFDNIGDISISLFIYIDQDQFNQFIKYIKNNKIKQSIKIFNYDNLKNYLNNNNIIINDELSLPYSHSELFYQPEIIDILKIKYNKDILNLNNNHNHFFIDGFFDIINTDL